MLTRRRALAAAASSVILPAAGPLLVSGGEGVAAGGGALGNPGLAWNPPTNIGMNLSFTNFWNDGTGNCPAVPSGQWAALIPYGISWIRNLTNYYYTGTGVTKRVAPGAHFAVRAITSIAPLSTDPTQLSLTCSGSTYAVAAGEPLVLQNAITYTDTAGNTVTLPAQTPITCTGGTAGTVDQYYNSLTPSTINVSAGRTLVGSASTAVAGNQILHANFYLQGTGTPRGQIALYVQAVNAWLEAGFWIDHACSADKPPLMASQFGWTIVNALHVQEMAYWASQGWPPSKVLIAAANEIDWGQYLPGDTSIPWSEGYGGWFESTLYPVAREYFPNHTLSFGTGMGGGSGYLDQVTWWPADPNTILQIHGYLDDPNGYWPVEIDGTNTALLGNIMDWIDANAKRLGISQVYLQEYGLERNTNGQPTPNISPRLSALKTAALARNWLCCFWDASTLPENLDPYGYITQSSPSSPWAPLPTGIGALGL